MGEIRGEKVVFRRQDIVPLHALPSAQAHEPLVLRCAGRSRSGFAFRVLAAVFAVTAALAALLAGLVESGMFDRTLNARAVAALNHALGPRYSASVEHTVLRLAGFDGFALKAENARIVEAGSARELATTESVAMVLDPIALMSGRIAISRLDIAGARFDAALLPESAPLDLAQLRVSDVPDYLEATFGQLDGIRRLIVDNGMETVSVSDLGAVFRGPGGRPVEIAVPRLDFSRDADGVMRIGGRFAMNGDEGEIDLSAAGGDESAIDRLDGAIRSVALETFLLERDDAGAPRAGVQSVADIRVHARREAEGGAPALGLDIALAEGALYADGIAALLRPATLQASYNFDKGSIELASKGIGVGQSLFPFTGGLIDLDRISDRGEKGFAIDLLFRNAVSRPEDTGEAPIRFDAKASGRYLPGAGSLLFEELAVSSEKGAFAGSLALRFGGPAPEVSFVMIADRVDSAAVKQFWPFWLGKTARAWAAKNIFGGTVTNGRIELFMAGDRKREPGVPLDLGPEELKIDFELEGARMNVAGDIPPLRDTSGKFRLRGGRTEVTIAGGTAYLSSGRSVALKGGTFVLPEGYRKPLMAEMDIEVAGKADAVAELVTYRPIRALPPTGFVPEDFSGAVTAKVKARFGLIGRQNPPPPEWTAALALDGVDVNKPVSGHRIANVRGTLAVDANRADLDAKGEIEGVPLGIRLTEPVAKDAGVTRQLVLSGTLGDADRRKLLPGLDDIVSGKVEVRLEQTGDGPRLVEADVGAAAVSVPWIGWTKGSGIAAKVSFRAETKDAVTRVSGFSFTGDGFSVAGDMVLRGTALDTADFSTVRLSAEDRFRLRVERGKSGYSAVATGEVADIRPVLARLKTAGGGGKSGEKGQSASVRATLKRAIGFNGEGLSNVSLTYETNGRRISGLGLEALTDGGAPVVANLARRGKNDVIELTSGDAGAVARFTDIYRHMRGGLLNVRLRETAGQGWSGTVDIRKFSLVGEERLRSLVSTPTGEGGKSLNDAVRRQIDVSTVSFDRGFARLKVKDGTLAVENGVVRGQTVGATFQGTVRDAGGRTDMTGTFMPAYGLNRLFAELPLIGVILGNGRDRGLIGITFKLSGAFETPRLTINPLSIIAPGVFRNIFEFQ